MNTLLTRLLSLAAILASGLCHAKPAQIPNDWKTECIGYFNISFPGEVEIALSDIEADGRVTNPSFSYVRRPMLGGLAHGGQFQVTDKVSYDFFSKKKNDEMTYLDKLTIEQAKTGGSFKNYDNNRKDFFTKTFADLDGTAVTSYRWMEDRMYLHRVDTRYLHFTDAQVENYLAEFSDQFRPRKLYEIPQEPGYCIPYGFVKNTMPQHPRKLALSMVLKDHPDVTVELREWGVPLNVREPENEVNFLKKFWGIDGYAKGTKPVGFPRFPSVEMGGQKGRSVFVEITLPEECGHEEIPFNPQVSLPPIVCKTPEIDYGYMAYVAGEPSIKEDKPNLTLFVMRDSEYGPDGKPTIGKEELRKIAETIAASVTRR